MNLNSGLPSTLLAESDSVREFVKACIHPSSRGDVITTEELLLTYKHFCEDAGYDPIAPHTVAKMLPDLIAEIHGVHKRHDLKTEYGTSRGWSGLAMGRAY